VEVRQTLGGRYKLLDELGRGGMAVVWRARDEVLGRPVAVKLLAGRYAGDPQSRARIRDEARAAATLSHPNIAQVYDYGEADDRPYVVMELVNGPTLQQRVSAGPLPPRTVFRICGEVAAALAAAHLDGLVHRDVKMANIMVTASGAKVVDFGIAAAAGPAEPEEMLVGTPAYLAPERLTGSAVLPASDVYALGVLLYRLLAHESPWSVDSTTQMLRAHIYIEPAPLPPLPGVPHAVSALIASCLHKDPASRPSASQVSATLADAAEAADAQNRVRDRAEAPPPRVPRPADGRADNLAAAGMQAPLPAPPATAPPPTAPPATTPPAAAPPVTAPLGTPAPGTRIAEPWRGPNAGPAGAADRVGNAGPGGRGAGSRPAPGSDGPAAGPPGVSGAASSSGRDDGRTGGRDRGGPNSGTQNGSGRDNGGRDGSGRDGSGRDGGRGGSVGTRIGVRPDSPGVAGLPGPGGGGAHPVPRKQRKALLAVGGVVAAAIAALVAWLLFGDPPAGRPQGTSDETVSAAPAAQDSAGVSAAAPGASGTVPAATGVQGRPPIAGSGPVASASTGGSPAASPTSGSPDSPADSGAPVASQGPEGKRLTSPGGAVYAVCGAGKATLTSWEPAAGYTVQKVQPGPALTTEIVFAGTLSRYRMTVTCVAGTPTPVVLPL
jgi:serine/threonine-protein kinase